MPHYALFDHVLVAAQVEVSRRTTLLGEEIKTRTDYHCTACNQTWQQPPVSKCPGVPIYRWDAWPAGLFTRKQLAAKKLDAGPLAGVIAYDKSADGDGWLRLYRESEATPKPALSPNRQAALAKAQAAAEAARHCTDCGDRLYTSRELRRGICERCYDQQVAEVDRRKAGRIAYDLITGDEDFAVWDSETTDLDGRFVEIAVVSRYGKVLFDQRIRPGCLVADGAYAVHGIKDEELATCPTFYDLYHDLRAALHNKRWVIYNADFDMGRLSSAVWGRYSSYYERYPIEPAGVTCAMHLYAQWYGEWHGHYKSYRWQKLGDAATHLGIDIDLPAHSALGDSLTTLEILYSLADWYRKEAL